MQPSAATSGVHHVGLTVSDLHAAADFFRQQLGFSEVGGRPDYPAIFLSDGAVMLTLWQIADPATARPFDRKNTVGLHHLALRIGDDQDLAALHERLRATGGVDIEFAPEPLGQSGLRHMICTVPGGIRLELVAA